MRLGLALPHYDTSLGGRPASWEGVRRTAEVAEEAGFASLWVSDHLFLDWGKYGGSEEPQGALECWTTLSALAAVTTRVRLGSLTLCNDLRHPALVAKMAATLALLSEGRLEVGLGAGWYEPEYEAAGIPFDPPGARIRRAGEAATIIRRLVAGEEVTFSGRYYELDAALCRPVADAPPRVWLGGKGDYLLKVAARAADGWNFSWVGSLEAYRARAAAADRACESVGRDPAALARSVGAYVLVGRDERDLRARFERLLAVTPPGILQGADGRAVSFEEFRATAIAGTVDEVLDKMGSLADLGVEEVVAGLGAIPFQVADLDDVELVGSEIGSALSRT